MAARVQRARQRMAARNPGRCCNGALSGQALVEVANLSEEARRLWEGAIEQRRLSARAGLRLLRVARTIADLEESAAIDSGAIAEALSYRSFDRIEAPAGGGP